MNWEATTSLTQGDLLMQFSVTQIKPEFSAITQYADAGEEVVVSARDRPAYSLLPIVAEPCRGGPIS